MAYESEEDVFKDTQIRVSYSLWYVLSNLQQQLRVIHRIKVNQSDILCALILKDEDVEVHRIVNAHFDDELRLMLYPPGDTIRM